MKKITKKLLFEALILTICCLFTSCIDYVQSISLRGNEIISNYKLTISKEIIEQSGQNIDEFFQQIDEIEAELPEGARLRQVNNQFEIGFQIKYSVDFNTTNEEELLYIPYESRETGDIYYPFMLGQDVEILEELLAEEDDEEMQSIMILFLDSAKCRYIISKNLEPKIKKAYFEGIDGNLELSVYDYGDSYGIEVPLLVLALGHENGLNLNYICVH